MKVSKVELKQSRLNLEERQQRLHDAYEQNKNKPVLDEYYQCILEDLMNMDRDIAKSCKSLTGINFDMFNG